MHRAFESWSANHRFLSFVDVSADCMRRHGNVSSSCELVELWVTARNPHDHALGSEAARAWPNATTTRNFRYTSGERPQLWDAQLGRLVPREVIETVGGVISFTGRRANADEPLCWYLDSTFCSGFHSSSNCPG